MEYAAADVGRSRRYLGCGGSDSYEPDRSSVESIEPGCENCSRVTELSTMTIHCMSSPEYQWVAVKPYRAAMTNPTSAGSIVREVMVECVVSMRRSAASADLGRLVVWVELR